MSLSSFYMVKGYHLDLISVGAGLSHGLISKIGTLSPVAYCKLYTPVTPTVASSHGSNILFSCTYAATLLIVTYIISLVSPAPYNTNMHLLPSAPVHAATPSMTLHSILYHLFTSYLPFTPVSTSP
jgi:hypothetical protein